MKTILIAIMAIALTGCASAPAIVDADQLRTLPGAEMSECPAPTPLRGRSPEDVGNKLGEVSALYQECKRRQKKLADWIIDGRPATEK